MTAQSRFSFLILISLIFSLSQACKKVRNINIDASGEETKASLSASEAELRILFDEESKLIGKLHLSAGAVQGKDPCSPDLKKEMRAAILDCLVPHNGYLPLFINQVVRDCQGISQKIEPEGSDFLVFAACRSAKIAEVEAGYSLSLTP